jgi:WD40 repeat protein
LKFNHGNTLLACSRPEDPKVEIRDVASGRNLPTLQCPGGVSAVAWSLDDKRLATACPDFSIQVWDAETGQRQTVFEGSPCYVMSLAFNHAGNLLASAGYDGKVRLWYAETGRQVAIHSGTSWQIQFSPDDRYLMGWQELSRFGWLEVVANREYRQLYVPRDVGSISEPVFSPDGRILAAGSQNNIRFWDANSWQRLGSIHQPFSDQCLFNPDGRGFVGTDSFYGVRLRDMQHTGGRASSAYRLGKPRLFYGAAPIKGASFSSDGRYLAVTEPDNAQACVFDLRNPAAKVVLAPHARVDRIALSPDGRWAATASFYDAQVKVWDAHSGDLLRSFNMPDRADVTFSPDGRWLAGSSSQYQLWEVGSWQPKNPPTPGFQGLGSNFTAFSPDGKVMARSDGQKILLLETLTEKPLATLEPPGSPTVQKFQFSPDGARLAVVQNDDQVELWDLRLIRQELAQMHLDWDMPPYPPVTNAPGDSPVTLEIEPDPASPDPAPDGTSSAAR